MIKNGIYPESYRKNLILLAWLRAIAIIGQSVAVIFTIHWLLIPLDTAPLWLIVMASAGIHLLTCLRLASHADISRQELMAHLLVDIFALFGLLYFSGGASNPFAPLFIIQVVIAAITLPPLHTWAIAGLTIILYTVLLFWNVEVPYFMHHHIGNYFTIHVQGMWVSFVLLALLVAGFIVRVSSIVRRQDQMLADAQRMGALGALAAGAAHELATPLSTIALLAQQFETSATMPGNQQNVGILREQVARCKTILNRMTAAAGVMRADTGKAMPLDGFLEAMIGRFRQLKPDVLCHVRMHAAPHVPMIVAEQSVEQAIISLLCNAAEASPQKIDVDMRWDDTNIHIAIRDYGQGIESALLEQLGEPVLSTKGGMGLGIFLARSVIARIGGSLDIYNHKEGGVQADIRLPLAGIAI
jgi:two-component system sensor histidine kinase RegB